MWLSFQVRETRARRPGLGSTTKVVYRSVQAHACGTTRLHSRLLGSWTSRLVGGFEEATLYAHGKHRVAMKARKGFIKYALQHGYALTPIYTFGEERSFHTFSGLLGLRLWLNSFQVPAVAFWGEPLLPLFPRRDAPCLSYVAPPLLLPQIAEPSTVQVDAWHAKYLQALQKLFDDSKADASEPDAALEVR